MLCAASEAALAGVQFRTICVDTRRVDKRFPLTSMETNARIGAHLCGTFGVRANLTNPDVTVSVEIADGTAYVYSRRVPGAGGLPSGVSGRVVGLLSAGFDSPVACWQMMKRGCNVVFVHFHSMPYTGEQSVEQVRNIVRRLTPYQYRSKLYIVPFAAVQNDIVLRTEPPPDHSLPADDAADRGEDRRREKAEGLVTGEAVGQVASQTLGTFVSSTPRQRSPSCARCPGPIRRKRSLRRDGSARTTFRANRMTIAAHSSPPEPPDRADPPVRTRRQSSISGATRMALSAVTIERFRHRRPETVEHSDALHA